MALILTFLLNTLLLRRRFEPLERLLAMMERVDLSRPGRRARARHGDARACSTDIQRLAATFNRMLERLERERRRSGELVLQAQEEERKRIARDLHDEVNQALTALLLRLEAVAQDAPPELQEELAETKQLAQPGDGRAARPRAAAAARRRSTTTASSRRSRRTSATTTARGPARAELLGRPGARGTAAGRAGRDLPRRAGGARRTPPAIPAPAHIEVSLERQDDARRRAAGDRQRQRLRRSRTRARAGPVRHARARAAGGRQARGRLPPRQGHDREARGPAADRAPARAAALGRAD